MKIKTGDKVKIIAGKDKGKTGKVLQVFIKEKKAVIEGLNLLIKHQRPKKQGEKGQKIQFPAPLAISNIMLICPRCGRLARVAYKTIKQENSRAKIIKNRICGKCKEVI
ncbi:50S ribosomal protein L24 [Candidatus Falkowbacteria bacterium]|nr:50S ribosomal protein L24 [Candidatus Falkowbacteria bacterium]